MAISSVGVRQYTPPPQKSASIANSQAAAQRAQQQTADAQRAQAQPVQRPANTGRIDTMA